MELKGTKYLTRENTYDSKKNTFANCGIEIEMLET